MTKISDDILLQLGRLTVNFSALEAHLRLLLWSFIAADQRVGQIVTAELSYRKMLKTLCAIATYKIGDENKLKVFTSLLKRSGVVEDRRNSLVHSYYPVRDDGAVTRIKISANEKKGLQIANEPIGAGEVTTINDEIRQIIEGLKPFLDEYTQMPSASK